MHDLLRQTESGSYHGLRGRELVTSEHALSNSEDKLTVARIPKT